MTANRSRGLRLIMGTMLPCCLMGAAPLGGTEDSEAPSKAKSVKPETPKFVPHVLAVNQVGYSVGWPKRFLLQTQKELPNDEMKFDVVDDTGKVAYSGKMGPVVAFKRKEWFNWDTWSREGNFTEFETPGRYKAVITLDGKRTESYPFEIGKDLIPLRLAGLVRQFFYAQRCGCEVPGWHKLCHKDDAISPKDGQRHDFTGGWHDAANDPKYDQNEGAAFEILARYAARCSLAKVEDTGQCRGGKIPSPLDEALWGAAYHRKLMDSETGRILWQIRDRMPSGRKVKEVMSGPSISARVGAGFAWVYAANKDKSYLADAEKIWQTLKSEPVDVKDDRAGCGQFELDLALFAATGEKQYAEHAHGMIDAILAARFEDGEWTSPSRYTMTRNFGRGAVAGQMVRYIMMFPDSPKRDEATAALREWVAHLVKCAQNPWRFLQHSETMLLAKKKDWYVMSNGGYCSTTAALLWMEKVMPEEKQRTRPLVQGTVDWLLGINPFSICQLQGVGTISPLKYQSARLEAPLKGAMNLGFSTEGGRPIVNVTRPAEFVWPDWRTNEIWLPYQARLLEMLAAMHEVEGE